MLTEAASAFSTYIDDALSVYKRHCCCSVDPRDDPQGRCSDVVVFTDWDTKEDGAGYAGYSSPMVPEPAAVRRGAKQATEGKMTPRRKPPSSDISAAPRDGADAATEEALALREMMKRFVQDMVHGRAYLVVVENGRTEPCKLLLTPNMQYIQLEAQGILHDVPLKNVKDICPGKLMENRFTPIVLDELCSTLVLRNNECVTFRLGSLKERDEFTKCIKVLSLALE
eukprot:TRINITY_DN46740_c0_g1_i1.p1 TRINITY_DN46740_c0_g1~~TRINITY_DN46740_c0_g1_i1.p1  ORF type:complete len:226 (-),score=38.54 TRINITY_DN46740_c0_g1_i1:69-746(-)